MTASYTQTPSILRESDFPIHRKLKDIGWKWRRKLTHHLRSSSHICISEPRVVWGECTQSLHLQGRQDYISQHTSCSRGNLADRSTLKSWFQVMRVCKCFIFFLLFSASITSAWWLIGGYECHSACMDIRGQLVGSWFFPSTTWVLEIKLIFSGLMASSFTHWGFSLAQMSDFS